MIKPSRLEIRTLEAPQVYSDPRGIIVNIPSNSIGHLAAYTSKEGAIRGNHYHPHPEEVYLLSGLYELIVKDLDDPEGGVERHVIRSGQLVICQARVAHAQYTLTDSTFVAISSQPKGKDTKDHTFSYELIEIVNDEVCVVG